MSRKLYIEVTNTLDNNSWSGIQRVTVEIIRKLVSKQMDITLLYYCPYCKSFRHLNKHELIRILKGTHPRRVNFHRFPSRLLHKLRLVKCRRVSESKFDSGSIFLDVEASWHNPCDRNVLLPKLKSHGITPVKIHFDLIPILFPQYVPNATQKKYEKHLQAHLAHTKHFICISKSTQNDLDTFIRENELIEKHIYSFQLGTNFSSQQIESSKFKADHKRYLLAVGTLEIRKNRKVILEVFDNLKERFPDLELIFVGKKGWMAEDTKEKIMNHSDYNKRIFWYQKLDDHGLNILYENAFLVIESSLYEGYGLPVSEALQRGCITLSSNRGALPEAGGDFAIYFDPEDEDDLYQKLHPLLLDADYYRKIKDKVKGYRGITWEGSASQLVHILDQIQN